MQIFDHKVKWDKPNTVEILHWTYEYISEYDI